MYQNFFAAANTPLNSAVKLETSFLSLARIAEDCMRLNDAIEISARASMASLSLYISGSSGKSVGKNEEK